MVTTRSRIGPAPDIVDIPTPTRVRKMKCPLENITNDGSKPSAKPKTPAARSPPDDAVPSTMDDCHAAGCAELDRELESILSPTFSTASDFCRTPMGDLDLGAIRDNSEEGWGREQSPHRVAHDGSESDGGDDRGDQAHSGDLFDDLILGMGALALKSPGAPLRGIPAREGEHMRFEEKDNGDVVPVPSPTNGKLKLAGVPVCRGTHVRF